MLTRAWQALLKGLTEVQAAPAPQKAMEMVVIRLIHAAGLPTPDEAIRALRGDAGPATTGGPAAPPPAVPDPPRAHRPDPVSDAVPRAGGGPAPAAAAQAVAPTVDVDPQPPAPPVAATADNDDGDADAALPADFAALVTLLEDDGDPELWSRLQTDVRLVRYTPGRLEFNPLPQAPRDLASRLMAALKARTGTRWAVSVSNAPGQPTLMEQREAAEAEALNAAADHPLVRATLEAFPGARLAGVVRVFDPVDPAGPSDDAAAPDLDPEEIRDDEEPW